MSFAASAALYLLTCSSEGHQAMSCERLNSYSLDSVESPLSESVTPDEEMMEYLKTINGVMERRNYAEAREEKSEDVRLEETSKLKEIFKREGKWNCSSPK